MQELQIVTRSICQILIIVILCVLSIYDVKYREVPVVGVALGLAIGMVYRMCKDGKEIEIDNVVWAVIIGAIFILISMFTNAIGLGDGLSLIISVLCIAYDMIIIEMLIMAIGSIVTALVFILQRKKKALIPYVPIITISHIFTLVLEHCL